MMENEKQVVTRLKILDSIVNKTICELQKIGFMLELDPTPENAPAEIKKFFEIESIKERREVLKKAVQIVKEADASFKSAGLGIVLYEFHGYFNHLNTCHDRNEGEKDTCSSELGLKTDVYCLRANTRLDSLKRIVDSFDLKEKEVEATIQIEVISLEDLKKWKEEFVEQLISIFSEKTQQLPEGRARIVKKDDGNLSVTISGKDRGTEKITEILKDSVRSVNEQNKMLVATCGRTGYQFYQDKLINRCLVEIELQ